MITKLSVNVNKIATLRNARGENMPNVVEVALDCERFGADGITVHPRPDERHITRQDVLDLALVVKTEFNVEGYPNDRYMQLVSEVLPAQATLVPDSIDVLTSNHALRSNQGPILMLVLPRQRMKKLLLVDRLGRAGHRVPCIIRCDQHHILPRTQCSPDSYPQKSRIEFLFAGAPELVQ